MIILFLLGILILTIIGLVYVKRTGPYCMDCGVHMEATVLEAERFAYKCPCCQRVRLKDDAHRKHY